MMRHVAYFAKMAATRTQGSPKHYESPGHTKK